MPLQEKDKSLEQTKTSPELEHWSEKVRNLTKQILEELPFSAFAMGNRCMMKHSSHLSGFITLENALAGVFEISVLDSSAKPGKVFSTYLETVEYQSML